MDFGVLGACYDDEYLRLRCKTILLGWEEDLLTCIILSIT
jgi:hypothetical protein